MYASLHVALFRFLGEQLVTATYSCANNTVGASARHCSSGQYCGAGRWSSRRHLSAEKYHHPTCRHDLETIRSSRRYISVEKRRSSRWHTRIQLNPQNTTPTLTALLLPAATYRAEATPSARSGLRSACLSLYNHGAKNSDSNFYRLQQRLADDKLCADSEAVK